MIARRRRSGAPRTKARFHKARGFVKACPRVVPLRIQTLWHPHGDGTYLKAMRFYHDRIVQLVPDLWADYRCHFTLEESGTLVASAACAPSKARGTRYEAYTIEEPGHVSVCLVDRRQCLVEFFDTAWSASTRDIVSGLRWHFPGCWVVPVNRGAEIQQGPDVFCQTWIFYYLYRRLVCGQAADQVIRDIADLPPRRLSTPPRGGDGGTAAAGSSTPRCRV